MHLCADIGGTKTRLALSEHRDAASLQASAVYQNRAFATFADLLTRYLHEHAGNITVQHASFAIAGPVRDRQCTMTNLNWTIDADALATQFGLASINLINDLAATALAIPALDRERDFVPVQNAGHFLPQRTPKAVLSVGTGLVEALLLAGESGGFRAVASEGGHKDFAPHSAEARAVYARILKQENAAFLCTEAIIAGPGMPRLYAALGGTEALSPAAIIERALKQNDPLCRQTITVLLDALAAEAANAALQYVSDGGVVIAGGLLPRLLPLLDRERFQRCFAERQHYGDWLRSLPVMICTNPDAPLLGARSA